MKRNGDFDSNTLGFMEIDHLVYGYDDNFSTIPIAIGIAQLL
ncbi:hypothetical protein [Flavobacterium sp.]